MRGESFRNTIRYLLYLKENEMDVCCPNGYNYQARQSNVKNECSETLPVHSASSTVPLEAVVRVVPHGIHSV